MGMVFSRKNELMLKGLDCIVRIEKSSFIAQIENRRGKKEKSKAAKIQV